MKSFFKRSAISLAVLGMAGSAYATHTTMVNNSSWSPQISGVFIGVEGLDLRPMNGDLDYVTITPNAVGQAFSTNNIDTTYDWSWRVFGGIKFTENDDITVSWMQMRTSDTDSISLVQNPGSFISSSPRFINFNQAAWENVTGKVTFNLDDAYAVWGHTINFNNPWSVRFAAGVEYANLKSKLTVTENAPTFSVPTVGYTAKSDLNGIGPRAEFDMAYHLGYGFALFGNVNGALLVSKRDISLDPVVSDAVIDGDGDVDFFASDYSSRHVVIPKFGARLGASYTYVWGQGGGEGACQNTSLTVAAGWQVESYIHAIERPDEGFSSSSIDLLQPSSSGFAGSTKTSNFSDSGLFVGVKLNYDWM